jgi:hypothetical protein
LKIIRYNLGLFSNGGNIEAKKTAVTGSALTAMSDEC